MKRKKIYSLIACFIVCTNSVYAMKHCRKQAKRQREELGHVHEHDGSSVMEPIVHLGKSPQEINKHYESSFASDCPVIKKGRLRKVLISEGMGARAAIELLGNISNPPDEWVDAYEKRVEKEIAAYDDGEFNERLRALKKDTLFVVTRESLVSRIGSFGFDALQKEAGLDVFTYMICCGLKTVCTIGVGQGLMKENVRPRYLYLDALIEDWTKSYDGFCNAITSYQLHIPDDVFPIALKKVQQYAGVVARSVLQGGEKYKESLERHKMGEDSLFKGLRSFLEHNCPLDVTSEDKDRIAYLNACIIHYMKSFVEKKKDK